MPSDLIVRSYAGVQAVLDDVEGFTAVGAIDCGQRRPLIPLQSSLSDHPRHRAAVESVLSSRMMTELEPTLRDLANELIDSFADAGEVDINSAVSRPFPVRALTVLLGLPASEHVTIRSFHDGILGPFPEPPAAGAVESPADVGHRIYRFFHPLVNHRRTSPGPDLISSLQAQPSEGSWLSDDEIVDVCYLLVLAGIDPVARALACSIAFFASRPVERAQAMASSRRLRRMVEELLRWGSSVDVLTRVATGDGAIDGDHVLPGRRVRCALAVANRDPDAFDRPAEVDPDRRQPHLAFGSGPHRCVGAHLARLQIRVVLEELHRRLPDHRLAPSSVGVDPASLTPDEHLDLVF